MAVFTTAQFLSVFAHFQQLTGVQPAGLANILFSWY